MARSTAVVLAEAELTLVKAYEIAQSEDVARKQTGKLRSSSWPQEVKHLNLPNNGGKRPCFRCGKTDHGPGKCYYWSQKCLSCGNRVNYNSQPSAIF